MRTRADSFRSRGGTNWPARSGILKHWPMRVNSSALHAPATHRHVLDRLKDQVFHDESEQDHGQEPGEDVRNEQLILLLEDVPSQPARARADADHQFSGDECAPGERPSYSQTGEDVGKSRG